MLMRIELSNRILMLKKGSHQKQHQLCLNMGPFVGPPLHQLACPQPARIRSTFSALRSTLLFLLLAFLLVACNRVEIQPLTFAQTPWLAGEVSQYQITDVNGQPAGTAQFTIEQGEEQEQDGWSIQREIAAQGSNEVVTVELNSVLRPITSTLVRTGGQQRVQESVKATYDSGRVEMELTTAQNVTTYQRVNITSDARDGWVLLPVLRALPLADRYATRINSFVPILGRMDTFTVSVVGSEQVTVPAGTFTTYKVELSARDHKTTAWFSHDAPHVLVKYVDGRNRGTFELTEFQPGAS
jgi:hypothetical protein